MGPDTQKSLASIQKEAKRFLDTHGLAYANFEYDAASDAFTPEGNGANCGYDISGKDYILTAHPSHEC